jgi:hypothetical protein
MSAKDDPSRKKQPKAGEVVEYWAVTDLWERKGLESPDDLRDEGLCFACLRYGIDVTRAHIVPRGIIENGSDDASNIHMLCATCHRDSEALRTPEEYWPWLIGRSQFDHAISFMNCTLGVNVHTELEKARPGLGWEVLRICWEARDRIMEERKA